MIAPVVDAFKYLTQVCDVFFVFSFVCYALIQLMPLLSQVFCSFVIKKRNFDEIDGLSFCQCLVFIVQSKKLVSFE